jgi:predicted GIY-YIG superfamily endonuclease
MSARYVYRCFDVSGRLLYVGCTSDLAARLKAHAAQSFWARSVANVKACVFPTAVAGLAAERRVIREENPRFNITGRWQHHASWSSTDFDDYIFTWEQRPYLTDWSREHLDRVRRARLMERAMAEADARAETAVSA